MTRSLNASSGYLDSLAGTLGRLFDTLGHSSELRLREVDYMSDAHIQQVQRWSQTQGQEVNRCLHEIVHEQSLRRPDHEAVCAWDGTMTYRELWSHVERLAQVLSDLGIGPEVVVPICFEKSVWTTVAMLAVLEAGGGFCPLDATQSNSRLRALALRLEAKFLLCSPSYTEKLSSVVNQVLPIGAEMFKGLPEASERVKACTTPANIAYVMWTSGSTGQPKAIIIEHRGYASGANAHAPAYSMHEDSRILQYGSYVFDASIIEILTPLMIGATICVPSEEARYDDLPAAIKQYHVDWACLTPSVVNFLIPAEVPGLTTLLLVGEVMSPENLSTWSGINLINGYGPAECSVAAAGNSEINTNRQPTMIGHGIGVRCWLVDPANHNRLVPPGCTAELVLEGPTLARGYLDDVERTSQSFINDPTWAKAAGDHRARRRMYKSGDLVRYHTTTGMMFFIGRKDSQVKLHGQRIELGEIEHHLASDDNLQQSMVIMPKEGPFSQRLVALISLKQASTADHGTRRLRLQMMNKAEQEKAEPLVAQTRGRLARQLPAFMVPSVWLVVHSIPLLLSGKLDRTVASNWVAGLNETEISQLFGDGGSNEQPTTELETLLRSIWSYALNLKPTQVGMKQSFLSLGGDSISAMMVQSQCKKENMGFTVKDILRAKSVSHLATLSRGIRRSVTQVERIEKDFDLSPIQSLYFELPNRGKDHFNQSIFVRLARNFPPAIIHEATKSIVNRHSMLRARFRHSASDDEWKQRITTDVTGS
ncbi:MAG: hypothetical protein Q9224_005756, partial [Gallowayella concinna]